MSNRFTYFVKGILLRSVTSDPSDNENGSIFYNSTSNKLKGYIESAVREIVTNSQTQTLTNKTIDADLNTITNIDNADIKAAAGIDASKIADGSVSNSEFQFINSVTSNVQDQLDAKASTSSLSTHTGASSGVHGVVGSVVGTSDSQTLTNKTIDADLNTLSNIDNADIKIGANIDAEKLGTGVISNTEFNYLNGVTSDIQTQLNAKQATVTGAATTIVSADLTINRAVVSDGSGKVAVSSVTSTELGYVSGVTSALQTQLNAKQGTLTNSAGLAAALSDETGSGLAVFNTSPALVTPSTDVVSFSQQTTPASPSAGNNKLYFKNDGSLYSLDSTGSEAVVGGGTSSLNTVFQLKGDESIGVWSSGNNASFLGGGSIAGTFVKNTTAVLHGLADYKYTQAAGSLNDYFASAVQTVAPKFRGQTVFFTFNYKYDGNNVDIQPILYDVTNASIISDTTVRISLNSTIASSIMLSAGIPSTCTQVRIGFQVKTLNSGKIFQFDDIQVSSDVGQVIASGPEAAVRLITGNGFGSTNTGVRRFSTNELTLGSSILYTDSATLGASFRINEAGIYSVTYSDNTTAGLVTNVRIMRNTVTSGSTNCLSIAHINSGSGIDNNTCSWSGKLVPGDIVYATSDIPGRINSSSTEAKFTIAKTKDTNGAYLVPNEQFSSDTASFVFKSTAIVSTDPVGTFNTYTYAASGNTPTIAGTAPTQTTSDMNTNGIQLTGRAFTAASTAALPARIDIFVGKDLKGKEIAAYAATAKTNPYSWDLRTGSATTTEIGTSVIYSPKTGILTLDVGAGNGTTRLVGLDLINNAGVGTGYYTFDLSKTPAMTAVPVVNQQIVYLKDVKANGTQGGTATSGSWYTRTLNTVEGDSYLATLSSNQFTLQAGTYEIISYVPNCTTDSSLSRLRNITDSTTTAISSNVRSGASAQNNAISTILSRFTITSAKVFEIQNQVQTTVSTFGNGYFHGFATGESEVYTMVRITKIK